MSKEAAKAALREAIRPLLIRRLYFVERKSFDAIAEQLGISADSVRDALVFRSPAALSLPAGPYRKDEP